MLKRLWGAALAATALALACALPAHAADNYPVRDGTGASQTFCSRQVAGVQIPCHLMYGLFGSTPTAVTMDGSNLNVHVQASALPSGAATSANQDTANTNLGQLITLDTGISGTIGTTGDAAWSGTGSGTQVAIEKYIAAKMEATRALLAGTLTINLPTGASTAANQTAPQANAGSDATKAIAVQGITGGKAITVTQGALPASGVTPVASTFTTTGVSATFSPIAGRSFNITLTGTFSASVQLERSFDSGATWVPLTAAGTQIYVFTAPASEPAAESEVGVVYRLDCTSYTSGTVTYRLSQ